MNSSAIRLFLGIVVLLPACVNDQPESISPETDGNSGPQIRVLSAAEVVVGRTRDEHRRFIADTLFEALQALDDDRLLTPVDDNAHARFARVLAYEPANEIALQGLEDIVLRYLQLAQEAMRRGLFEDAEAMIDRARFVNSDHPNIAASVSNLQAEMNSKDLFFNLDGSEFSSRSAAAIRQLADIARQAREAEAFFLITAPNDDLARWMYAQMREAVSGYRLRGNIELASRTSVRLRMPDDSE